MKQVPFGSHARRKAALSAIPKRKQSEKLAISLEAALAADVRRAARQEAGNVSACLSAAARQRLRHLAAGEALKAYEAEHGAITEDELAEAGRQWRG